MKVSQQLLQKNISPQERDNLITQQSALANDVKKLEGESSKLTDTGSSFIRSKN